MQYLIFKPIKGFKSFSKIFQAGKKFYDNDAVLSVCFRPCTVFEDLVKNDESDAQKLYYGVTISKKKAKKAVVRNRIKRLLRVSIIKTVSDYTGEDTICPFEYVIVSWKKAPSHPKLIHLNDVQPVVKRILRKANDYYLSNLQEDKL